MRFLAFALLAVLMVSSESRAQQLAGAAKWADSARREIEAAYFASDTTRLAAVRVLLERALTAHPGDVLLLHYRGYAAYREANVRMGRWKQEVKELLDEAENDLDRSMRAHETAESVALLGSVIGQKIGSNPLRGMTLGPRSTRLMERATERWPRNPRAWLLRGIGAIFTPGMFGGGLDRAREYLERATVLFAEDSPSPPSPSWGHDEAYAWLGQVHAREGRTQEARQAYMKALELEPGNQWVRQQLLPALDRAR